MTGISRKSVFVIVVTVAAVVFLSVSAAFYLRTRRDTKQETAFTKRETEEWFSDVQNETEENFDFGLDEYWIDLDDLEYSVKDKLKCYLFIGTDHSGNEDAKDESYQGSMADFLLVAILNKTKGTYGFIQLNRDTITDVPIIDELGDTLGSSEEQLCTAHWYGGSRQQSCLNTVEAVSDLLGGLEIDGYYSIGMDEIAQLNHIIGGATVTIEDDFSRIDPTMEKGKTITLTDQQAVYYLQGRMDVGDGENTSRMRRQRTYMEAVYDKVIERVRAEKRFLEDITDTLGESVTTNMNGEDYARIRDLFRNGKSLGIQSPEGETMLGTKLEDGLEHTEFYMDSASLAKIMIRQCNLEMDEFSDWDELETETEIWEDFS